MLLRNWIRPAEMWQMCRVSGIFGARPRGAKLVLVAVNTAAPQPALRRFASIIAFLFITESERTSLRAVWAEISLDVVKGLDPPRRNSAIRRQPYWGAERRITESERTSLRAVWAEI